MKKIVTSSFTLKMLLKLLETEGTQCVEFKLLSVDEATAFAKTAESSIGNEDAAYRISAILGVVGLSANRQPDILNSGDEVLVALYEGPPLTKGSKAMPAGSTYYWVLLKVE